MASFAALGRNRPSRLNQSMDALVRDEIRYKTRCPEHSDRSPALRSQNHAGGFLREGEKEVASRLEMSYLVRQ